MYSRALPLLSVLRGSIYGVVSIFFFVPSFPTRGKFLVDFCFPSAKLTHDMKRGPSDCYDF